MLEVSDLSHVQDKLARFPPAYKQLVNLIRQGKPDAQCHEELWARRMHFDLIEKKGKMVEPTIEEAVVICANSLGVKEGSYDERRRQIGFIGVDFFGTAASSGELRHRTDRQPPKKKIQEAFPLPEVGELARRIRNLAPLQRRRLEIYVRSKGQVTARDAAEAGLRGANSLIACMSEIFNKLDLRGSVGHTFLKKRKELVCNALALLHEPAE